MVGEMTVPLQIKKKWMALWSGRPRTEQRSVLRPSPVVDSVIEKVSFGAGYVESDVMKCSWTNGSSSSMMITTRTNICSNSLLTKTDTDSCKRDLTE